MSNRHRARAVAAGLALVAACGTSRTLPPGGGTAAVPLPARAPRNGLEVVAWMRRSHPRRALTSLAFTVTTTTPAGDSVVVTRARVLVSLPGRLRVAELPASRRSGMIRDRQLLAVFERGRRVARASHVDLAQLVAYDLFAQSIDTTVMWLDSARMRFGLARRARFEGRRAWVVGAPADDSTSQQFWVDAERWRVLRVIQPDPTARNRTLDLRFTEFTMLRDVPVPIALDVYQSGRLVRRQAMTDFVVNPRVPTRAFDLARWRDVQVED